MEIIWFDSGVMHSQVMHIEVLCKISFSLVSMSSELFLCNLI